MPLYEYRCLKCGRVSEVLQRLSDRPLRKCEICSGQLKKLISRTSFQLKGGGWFSHGYGTAPAKQDRSKSSETASDTSGKSDSKSSSADSKASKKNGSSKTG